MRLSERACGALASIEKAYAKAVLKNAPEEGSEAVQLKDCKAKGACNN